MYSAAILLGVAGSPHCVGMCGPLMFALHAPGMQRSTLALLEYQLGRIITYAGLGLFFGLAGKGIALAGLQQILSVGAGILMIAFALMAWRIERAMGTLSWIQQYSAWVQQKMSGILRDRPEQKSLVFGLLNGLIPCGMVYAALAGAIAATDAWGGAGFMAAFGLGTAPLMLAAGILGQKFSSNMRHIFRRVQPVLLVVSGLLLIQRGLHLDLSLFQSAVPPAGLDCH